jgi:hypothetical protein
VIECELDTEHSILIARPKSALDCDDVVKLADAIDPHIEATGGLRGLILEAPAMPGFESLGAMVMHFSFVRRERIKKIALVTDSRVGDLEDLASDSVSAEISYFPAGQLEAAKQWIMNGS